jgi:hypothetical protein
MSQGARPTIAAAVGKGLSEIRVRWESAGPVAQVDETVEGARERMVKPRKSKMPGSSAPPRRRA